MFLDKLLGEARVSAALGMLHDLADQKADGLHFTIFYIFGGFGIFFNHPGDYFGKLAFVGFLDEIMLLGQSLDVFDLFVAG